MVAAATSAEEDAALDPRVKWAGRMRIDQTFVPWTATWLFYFKEWLASDEWKGGGEHPRLDEEEDHRHLRRRLRRG